MIGSIAVATAILAAAAIPAFAQDGNPPPAPRNAQPPAVIGQTGTMYDGNNANLRLPSDPNAYWARLWADPGASGKEGAASAAGTGVAGAPLGGAKTGGRH